MTISYDLPSYRQVHHKITAAVSGNKMVQEYAPVYDKSGVWHLQPTKRHDLYLEIQSHADSCDLNVIMQRYLSGETDLLQQVTGTYGDVSNVPTNYAEILNETLRAESLFASLAPDIRAQFGNSVSQFLTELGDGSAWDKLGVNRNPAPYGTDSALSRQQSAAEQKMSEGGDSHES